jgi:NADH dehydrogenase FAD-containing subunit
VLQVKGYPNIFAIGDSIDLDSCHLAYLAMQHAAQVAKSVHLLARNPDARLPEWQPDGCMKTSIVVMGKRNSLILLGEKTVLRWVPGSILNFKLSSTRRSIGFPK